MPATKSKKNPLYVVTNKGQDVQEATGFFDAIIKRFNLGPAIGLIETIIKEMLGLVTNFAMFSLVKEMIDQWLEQLINLVMQIQGMSSKKA